MQHAKQLVVEQLPLAASLPARFVRPADDDVE